MLFSNNHDDEQATFEEFMHQLVAPSLRVVCSVPNWQDLFVARARHANLDATTTRLIHDVLCLAEQCRAHFPGQDARLLEVAHAL